jgi:hypothetical protein
MPIILAAQEVETWRMMVQGHKIQGKSSRDLISTSKSWVWWQVQVISAIEGSTNRRMKVQAGPGIKGSPYSKHN